MKYSSIALRIYQGNSDKDRKSPKIILGELHNEFEPIYPVLVKENEVWIISHTLHYNVYEYNRLDETSQSFLHVTLSVATKYQIDDKSPLDVINSVLNIIDDYKYGDSIESKYNLLNTIINQCTLSDREPLLPVMWGKIAASYKVESLDTVKKLMKHSRYEKFATISHLEMGFNCATTISIGINPSVFITPKPIKPIQGPASTTNSRSKLWIAVSLIVIGIIAVVAITYISGDKTTAISLTDTSSDSITQTSDSSYQEQVISNTTETESTDNKKKNAREQVLKIVKNQGDLDECEIIWNNNLFFSEKEKDIIRDILKQEHNVGKYVLNKINSSPEKINSIEDIVEIYNEIKSEKNKINLSNPSKDKKDYNKVNKHRRRHRHRGGYGY